MKSFTCPQTQTQTPGADVWMYVIVSQTGFVLETLFSHILDENFIRLSGGMEGGGGVV